MTDIDTNILEKIKEPVKNIDMLLFLASLNNEIMTGQISTEDEIEKWTNNYIKEQGWTEKMQ